MATLHDTARHGRKEIFSMKKDSNPRIKLFYEFEMRKEFADGAVGGGLVVPWGCLPQLDAIRCEGDDAIVMP